MSAEKTLAGRVCLVTGANTGIGKETARGLARMGARVVMACRNPEKGEAARAEIATDTGNPDVELRIVDLGSQASIRAFAKTFVERHGSLHVLVNNAGIWTQARTESPEGIELTWATNVLAYALLADLLLPALQAAAPSRVVNVASEFARGLDLDDVEFKRRGYSGVTAYSQSKQANRMWTWALARRLEGTRVAANALHPGGVNTQLFRKAGGALGAVVSGFSRMVGRSPEEGADTAVWLASSPEVEGVSGLFWVDRAERPCRFRDVEAEERLFALCASMTAPRAATA